MLDAKGQLAQSAKDMRSMANRERVTKGKVEQQLNQVKTQVRETHNHGMKAQSSESVMNDLDRQVKNMQKDIDNLERQPGT